MQSIFKVQRASVYIVVSRDELECANQKKSKLESFQPSIEPSLRGA